MSPRRVKAGGTAASPPASPSSLVLGQGLTSLLDQLGLATPQRDELAFAFGQLAQLEIERAHFIELQRRFHELVAMGATQDKLHKEVMSWGGEAVAALEQLESRIGNLKPLADMGQRFRTGRKQGTESPIKTRVRLLLKRNPDLNNAEIWRALSQKPPTGFALRETTRLGRYIEGPEGNAGMSYARFRNVCAEIRRSA